MVRNEKDTTDGWFYIGMVAAGSKRMLAKGRSQASQSKIVNTESIIYSKEEKAPALWMK